VIPFVAIDEAKIAPLHPYGICVAIGFFVWDHVLMKMAVRRGFDRADFRVLTLWLGVLGWSFAWGVDAIFYHPGQSLGSRFTIQGLSSTGAIVGATIGAIVWSRLHVRKETTGWRATRRETPVALLPVSEVVLATWPAAFAFGRLGCALIHDHVGKAVAPGSLGSLLAVGFPRSAEDGVHHVYGPLHVFTGASDVRYDLGLLELMILAPLAIGFALTWKKDVAMGTYTIIASLVYGPLRFVLDFLRADEGPTGEARQGGLTFAQYWSLAVIALGVVLLVRQRRESRATRSGAPPNPTVQPAD
jgi:phosphatidylglycerol---prolipoprotein diacylglyceryl transferase